MSKFIARFAVLGAALTLAAAALPAQTPSAVVNLSPQAVHVIDSLAVVARTQRVEVAACVDSFTVAPLTIVTLGPATYTHADSLSIVTARGTGLCPAGVATVHSHVAKNGILYAPSPTDLRSKWRFAAPFALIVAVTDSGWSLVLY